MVESYFDMPGAPGPLMYVAPPPGGVTTTFPLHASAMRPWSAQNDLFEALFTTPQGRGAMVPAWSSTANPRACSMSAFATTASQPGLHTLPGQMVQAMNSPSSTDSPSAFSQSVCGTAAAGQQLLLELENSQLEIGDDATNADTATSSPASSLVDSSDDWALTSLNSGYAGMKAESTAPTFGARSAQAVSTSSMGAARPRGSLPQGSASGNASPASTLTSPRQHQQNNHAISSTDVDARAAAKAAGIPLEEYLRRFPIKPPLSYATLVARGILAHGPNGCTLRELYAWLERNFAYFGRSSQGPGAASWRSSVRHNLAFNPAFIRVASTNSDDAEEGGADSQSKDKTSKRARWLMSPEYVECLTPDGTFRRAKRSKKSPAQPVSPTTSAAPSPKSAKPSVPKSPSIKGVKRSASVPLDSSATTSAPKKVASGLTAPASKGQLAGIASSPSLATLLRESTLSDDVGSSDLLGALKSNSATFGTPATSTTGTDKDDNQQQLDLIAMLGLDDLADLVVDTTAMASQPRAASLVATPLSPPPPPFSRAASYPTVFSGLSAASVDEHFNMALMCRRSPMLCGDLDPQSSADISDLARWLLD